MNERRASMRRCIGCNSSFPREQLIRISYDGKELTVSNDKKTDGRGLYFCKNTECIMKGIKSRAFNRGFKKNFKEEETSPIFEELLDIVKEVSDDKKNR